MQILKLKGFLFEPSDPAVYDRDSKTVLELCGRLGYKINELIDEYNRFYDEMLEKYAEAYEYMVEHLDEAVAQELGAIVAEQLPAVASDIIQELYGETLEQMVSDILGLKSVTRAYLGVSDLKENGANAIVGDIVETLFYATNGDKGSARYLIVDSLEEGEIANNDTIIKIDDVDKWAKMLPEAIAKSSSFEDLQSATNFAFKNRIDVAVIGINEVDDLIIPFDSEDVNHKISFIGENHSGDMIVSNGTTSVIRVAGQIKQASEATLRNFTFANCTFEKSADFDDSLFGYFCEGGTHEVFTNCIFYGTYLNFTTDRPGNQIEFVTQLEFNHCSFDGAKIYQEFISGSKFLDCNFTADNDDYFQLPLYLKQSDVIIENSYFGGMGIDTLVKIENSNAITILNTSIESISNTDTPLILKNVTNSLIEDSKIVSDMVQDKCVLVDTCEHISFRNVTTYSEDTSSYGIYVNASTDCNFENICAPSGAKMIYFNNSSSNIIRYYNVIASTMIAEANASSNNYIELASETDIPYVTNVKIGIPSETKLGNTTLMNSLTGYEGRIYYNTETNSIMCYTNNAWVKVGETIQYELMPTATYTDEGKVIQYVGLTDTDYTKGHFYECVVSGTSPTGYEWSEISMGGGGSSSNYPVYYMNIYPGEFYVNKIPSALSSDSVNELIRISNDALTKGFTCYLLLINQVYNNESDNEPTLYMVTINLRNTNKILTLTGIASTYLGTSSSRTQPFCYGSASTYGTNLWLGGTANFDYTQVATLNNNVYTTSGVTYLATNNTASYTPTNDYNPATKKYVDDAVSGGGGSSDSPSIFTLKTTSGSSIDYITPAFTLNSTDKANFIAILNKALTNNLTKIIVHFIGELNRILKFDITNLDVTQSTSNILAYQVIDTESGSYNLFNYKASNTHTFCNRLVINVTCSNSTITDVTYSNAVNDGVVFLRTNNSVSFTPSGNYNPATKKYVDDSHKSSSQLSQLRCDHGNIITGALNGDSYFKQVKNLCSLMVFIELTGAISPSGDEDLLAIPLSFSPSTATTNGTRIFNFLGIHIDSTTGTSTPFVARGTITDLYNQSSTKEIVLFSVGLTASIGDIITLNLTWEI